MTEQLADAGFVVTKFWAMVIAFVALAVLAGLAHVLINVVQKTGGRSAAGSAPDIVRRRRSGIKALVMGADGRTSTSKLQVVLWTFAVFYAFAFLMVWGRSTGCEQATPEATSVCRQAARDRGVFDRVANRRLQSDYYALLGFPVAAAVAAKALTSNKVARGKVSKDAPTEEGAVRAIAESVTNDSGEMDLLDFQYVAFNLLTLAYFWVEFVLNPAGGLPTLPATLIALSGLSTASYTAKKALDEDSQPTVSAVVPRRLALATDTRFVITGGGFGPAPESSNGRRKDQKKAAEVWLDSVSLGTSNWDDNRIEVKLTSALAKKLGSSLNGNGEAEIIVVNDCGLASAPFSVETYKPRARSS